VEGPSTLRTSARLSIQYCSDGKYSVDDLLAASPGRVRRVWSLALEPPAGELQVRRYGGTDDAARLDGDFQPTVPPQAEADVVGEVFVAVARVEHVPDLHQEHNENKPVMKKPTSGRSSGFSLRERAHATSATREHC
jgi:hypothetical protein